MSKAKFQIKTPSAAVLRRRDVTWLVVDPDDPDCDERVRKDGTTWSLVRKGERQPGLKTRIWNTNAEPDLGDGNRDSIRKRLDTIGMHANLFGVQPNALVAIGSNRSIDPENSAVATTQSPHYSSFPSHRGPR
jgi:hypothetical protein